MRNRLCLAGLLVFLSACGSSDPGGNAGGGGGGGGIGGGGSGNDAGGGGSTSMDLSAPPASQPDMAMQDLAAGPDLALPADIAKFVGTWLYGTGAMGTTDCPGQMPQDLSAQTFMVSFKSGNTITFSAGAAINCSFDFTVSGTKATLVPGQSCNVTVSGTNATVAPDTGSMTTTDGVNGSLMAHAKVDGGLCTLTLSAGAAKKQ
jgi:hypothetical protein